METKKMNIKQLKSSKWMKSLTTISRNIEKVIIGVLIFMMTGILIFATYELARYLYLALFVDESLTALDNLMELFGGFLIVLIGLELLDTIKVYLKENVIHVEVVILVAIIALARKIVIMEIDSISGVKIIGIGIIIISLAASFYLIKRTGLMTLRVKNDLTEPFQKENEVSAALKESEVEEKEVKGTHTGTST
jgi:uncharacterized membrane protein (DUF373 family)